jgi:arginine decarboxylase
MSNEDKETMEEMIDYIFNSIDDEIAKAHAEMWLTKSMNHELELRDVDKHSEFQIFHNYINITQNFAYCLTALGFLNFEYAPIVEVK